MKKYRTKLSVQYGSVMKEYVEVPAALLKKTEELTTFFDISHAYVAKPTTRRKPAAGKRTAARKKKS